MDMDVRLSEDCGGRDWSALRMVWRGIESIEYEFFLCLLCVLLAVKDGFDGRSVRFSIDDTLLIAVAGWACSVREVSSEVMAR
jgi:hypothetical protein